MTGKYYFFLEDFRYITNGYPLFLSRYDPSFSHSYIGNILYQLKATKLIDYEDNFGTQLNLCHVLYDLYIQVFLVNFMKKHTQFPLEIIDLILKIAF